MNTKIAEKDRELVDKNYFLNQGKIRYCSVNATAHCSFDWSQNAQIPYSSQQASQRYFITALKIYLFGIQNEATKEQINFVLAENELLDKGINGTLSLVFAGILQFNRGEKHLKLTCDNAVGQNKNNVTIQFCQFLVMVGYYETVELNFMIPGHTKFKVDSNFGMIKRKYRKSTVYCKEEFVKVVEESSPQRLNKVQCYENGQGFQYFDFKVLGQYFVKISRIAKYHHFYFSADNVKVKEFVDSDWEEVDLLEDDGKERMKIIREIKNLVFLISKPEPLSLERQKYLYKEVRPLLPKKYWNTLPLPNYNIEVFSLS